MDLRLSGKTALVTGASRGIGLAITSALIAEGMRVIATARTITPELAATGAIGIPADLSGPDAPQHLVDRAIAEAGPLDLLVNNVGGGDGDLLAGFTELTDEQWQQTFELNFFSAVRTTRAALPSLLSREGTIINISSNGARQPHAGPMPYTTAKAALTAFGKALATEVGPRGVRVNTISPGPTRTALWESPDGHGAKLAQSLGIPLDELLARLPAEAGMTTGRLVDPAEVAALVAFLASPHAASTAGADHLVDGNATKTA
ncbi:NAD(P)-dependent dehydrogenase, short-chain alcohol dehydrogenase family [Saccharopolyspora kobensis]|uniref:NAD(P)-dependent dehydrogenase, short-chain alcohol dehydrogenase family n=1 Tax=Saccharopolyspora kobensis TaxID=146035 RepID=A0A1H6EML3_9PSEU|nr:SDR family oxidoreductase [Saccharopolyspora kobensis]SEG98226.1 NAD(P)-dependent dehydrogenase, short-chain alcohol dehydrogenase family [Saccharopolyspora kobensis]SFE71900.1 NAD(P)-dependent dehydrogenase, short-chain alcohol dehydrogenase family [Saccharopolyspora kobensis]